MTVDVKHVTVDVKECVSTGVFYHLVLYRKINDRMFRGPGFDMESTCQKYPSI